MSRDPPALAADDNPPSPLPPPTPYTEPPTPMTPQPDSPRPRLRPLRRLAARKDPPVERPPRRSRRLADADPDSNSEQDAPESEPHPSAPQSDPTSRPSTRSAADNPPPPDRPLTRSSANRHQSSPSKPVSDTPSTPPQPTPPPEPQQPDAHQPADQPQSAPTDPPETVDQDTAADAHDSPDKPPLSPPPLPATRSAAVSALESAPESASETQPAPERNSPPATAPERQPSPARPPSESASDAPKPQPQSPPPSGKPSSDKPSSDKPSSDRAQPPQTVEQPDQPMPQAPVQQSDQVQLDQTQQDPPEQPTKPVESPPTPPPIVDKIDLVQSEENVPETQPDLPMPDPTPSTPPMPSTGADVMELDASSSTPAQPPQESPTPPEPASKPPRPRQLAVRPDLPQPERRQLAVRTLAIKPPSPPHSPPPADPKPRSPPTPKTAPPASKQKSRPGSDSSSPEIVAFQTSRYSTRSATKDRELPSRRTRSRRQSEPVQAALSERRQRRRAQRRPVKGDRLRVLWHIDLVYYEGVVDSVLSYRGKKFYDVTYDSGEREYYLDLTTRKWRLVDEADGDLSDDSIPEPPPQSDYSNFPKIDDKVLVMWHVDGKYYPGVVQDILKTSTGWFYDVGYEGGDREFFLDLNVRKWKYATEEVKKSAPRPAPREKIKRAARKSTMGSTSYTPPPSSQPPLGPSISNVDDAGPEPSSALRVESLLEVKERQEQQRRAMEEEKQKKSEQVTKVADMSLEKQPEQRAPKTLQVGTDQVMDKPDATRKPKSDGIASGLQPPPPSVDPRVSAPAKDIPPHLESPFDIDLPELNEDAFENVMADIDAPLSIGSTRKRLRASAQQPQTEIQPKRLREPDTLDATPTVSLLEDEPQSSQPAPVNRQLDDLREDPLSYSPHDRHLASVHSDPFSSPRPVSSQRRALSSLPSSGSQLPPNAAPPARKTVQQRSRSRPAAVPKRKSQQLLQSEPNFIPRPRPSSRARSISRRPTSRRRASSPYPRTDRLKLRSRASSPDYSFMRPSPYPTSRAIDSRRRTKTTVADIVSVSGHAAKKWLDENTKQFTANLKRMDAELAKMKATHQKLVKTTKAPSKQTMKTITPRTEEMDISDGERESVLQNMMNDFLRRVHKYKVTVENREQSLLRQFAGFRKTLSGQNSKLVSTGKVLEKLDMQGLEALDNLQPVVRKKLEIPPPVAPRRPVKMDGTPPHSSPPSRFGRSPAEDHTPPTGRQLAQRDQQLQEKPAVPDQRSEAVVKTLRLKLADLVTRSDWLGEEVTRLKQREKALVREKREALTELTKIRSDKSFTKSDTVSAPPRILPARSTTSRPIQRAPLKPGTVKPVGIVKKTVAVDNRTDVRAGKATRKTLSPARVNYRPPTSIAPAPLGLELRSRTPKVVPPSALTAAKPTSMEDVTKPKYIEHPESEKAPAEIERGADFTDDLGKSMDKQASELLALIFTIWLLQDESRSEPPKQPGERMDSWVRSCVRNCLKHARTYLDATSGITTARRSLMHDVDGENIYTDWILGESDSTFEQARSNYSLWDPTLQDVEWLAEKRVLAGLSICYRKGWKETSARQYETTLMYAKAIAHRAVSNFELYMPPTIVLRAPVNPQPVAAKQMPQAIAPSGSTYKAPSQRTGQATPATGPASGPPAIQANVASQKPVPVSAAPLTNRAVSDQPAIVTLKGSIVTQPTSSGTPAKPRQEVLPPISNTVMKTGLTGSKKVAPNQSTSTPKPESVLKAHAPEKAHMPKSTETARSMAPGAKPTISASPSDTAHPASAHPASQGQKEMRSDHNKERPETTEQQHQGDTQIPSSTHSQSLGSQKPEKSGGKSSSNPGKDTAPPQRLGSVNPTISDRQGALTPLVSSSTQGIAMPGAQLPSKESGPKNLSTTTLEAGSSSKEVTVSSTAGQTQSVNRPPQEGKKTDSPSGTEATSSAVQAKQPSTAPKLSDVSRTVSDRKEDQPVQAQHSSAARASTDKTVSKTGSMSSQPLSLVAAGSSFPTTFSTMRGSTTNPATSLQQTSHANAGLQQEPQQGVQNESRPLASTARAAGKAVPAVLTSDPNLKGSDKGAQEPQTRSQLSEPVSGAADGRPRETQRTLRSNRSAVPGDGSELPSLPNLSTPRSTQSSGRRGPKASISKTSGAKGKKNSKSTRGKSSAGKSKATRVATRASEAAGVADSPRISHGKETTEQVASQAVPTSGMVGLMRLPGAPSTTQHTGSQSFPTFSTPMAPLTTRQPVGMKRLPLPGAPKSIPSMPQRRAAPGVDPLDFDSLPSPIPRRQASKGVSDDVFNPSPQYGMEQQQGNPFSGNGRWGTQQPVQRKGYKSLSMIPPSAHQGSNVVAHGSNPFESRAVAPFEYNRPVDQGAPTEQRPELMQEGNYHVVEQVDVMNPPTPASLSALEYGVEQVHREPLPNTTSEFQERFDRGYDPYRSQLGHIMNPAARDGPGVGRNIHTKDYGRR